MAAVTKKDMVDVLNEFYGKVLEPRFDRIEKKLDEHDQKFKDMLDHFDTLILPLNWQCHTVVLAREKEITENLK